MAAFAHFQCGARDRQRHADTPITGAVHPEALAAIHFDHVDGPGGGALGFRIKGHARPKTSIEDHLDSVLFNVVNDAALRFDSLIALEHVNDQARPLPFVLQVRSVDENELVVTRRQIDVQFQHFHFVAGIFVQPDLADAKHIGPVQEFWNNRQHFLRQLHIL